MDPSSTDRPFPARTGRLPRELGEITAPWLTRLLQHRWPQIEVRTLTVLECRNGHTTKLRVALDLDEASVAAGLPRQVCLKSNWSVGFESGDICELEARFYHLMRDRRELPLPTAWHADWDGDGGGRGVVMMEDLALSPGAFGHSSDHLGVDGVAQGLASLAVLHGALWGSEELGRQAWLHRSMDTPVDTEQLRRNWHYIALNLAKPDYQAFLPAWVIEQPERFSHAYDELVDAARSTTGPECLVHGDSHQGNSFLRASGERIWMDWQLVRRGQPWRDIVYFMLGALTIEERRQHAADLVRHYREALMATGARDVPDQASAWDQVRRWPLYGMQAWLGNVDAWGQGGRPMVERFFAAAEDFESLALLTHGRTPRRPARLGEGARPLAPGLQAG